MPRFAYAAIDASGSSVEGLTKADTVGEARALLLNQNLYPIKIQEKRGALQFELTTVKVKKKELMMFTRQLAVFVKAGIPITEAMEVIGDETTDVALQRTITEMVEDLRNGGTLSGAAAKHPEAFPTYYIGILSSAELTGKLDETLESLAGYLEREVETRAKVVSALSYPGVVMVLAFFTVCVLAGYVLPQFKPLFEELNADLPFATRALLWIGDLFTVMWYIPLSVVMAFVGFMVWMRKSDKGKVFKDKLVLKLPVISGIVEYAILERFCRILGAMVKAGVPLPDAMRTTTEATNNIVFRERLLEAQSEMMEGGGFSKPLARTELFPGAARQMFKVGEETGTLDKQLEVAAYYFDRELESRIKKFTTMFEPLMIVGVGVVVGFVAVALVQAMYGVLDGVKKDV
ncbi:MAG TPA: type II secretion system F family protein [Ilumatobacteraceae bacterium]|nr:type II secretion system F family protein [Ilumatobacteraceae bacterium]HRB05434.1 type II secretion system F family protein [Ilumatobacteraceae bacterium]